MESGSIPPLGMNVQLAPLSVDGHVALFLDSMDVRNEVVQDFIHEGFSHDEKVLFLGNPDIFNQIPTVLNRGQKASWLNQFGIIGGPCGEFFDPDLLTSFIDLELKRAYTEGFQGMRLVQDMTWILQGVADPHLFITYEAKIEALMQRRSFNLLCLFDQNSLDSNILLEALACHPHIQMGGESHENIFHVPVEKLIKQDRNRIHFEYGLTKLRKVIASREEFRGYQSSLVDLMQEHAENLRATQEMLLHKTNERLHLLDELSESKERYRSLFFENQLVMFLFDADTFEIVDANPAANRYYGYTRNQMIGMKVAEINQMPLDQLVLAIRDAREKRCSHFFFKHKLASGEIRDVEVHTGPLPMRGRTLIYSLVIDITQQKSLEAQLHQAQKMEAVGQLAGGVAHDFNNLISVIMGYSELAVEGLPIDHPIRSELGEVLKAAVHARSVTQQLLAFSRKQKLNQQIVDLNEVIYGISKILCRLVGEKIQLVFNLTPDLDPVFVDPGQIQQILINLVVNSRDAMPNGGSVVIHTAKTIFQKGRETATLGLSPGEYILLSVADRGCGIPAENLEKVFDPFFTTKEEGKGTGLGLSTVHGIVRQHGGRISLVSQPGQGTTFRLYFPTSNGIARGVHDKHAPIRSKARQGEAVLIVEDDDSVRHVARSVLRKYGYQVHDARGPHEAINKLRSECHDIHLLLTDVVMPEMNGWNLYQQILEEVPGLKVVFMSGHTDEVVGREGVDMQEFHFIHKPFAIEELLGEVRATLDEL